MKRDKTCEVMVGLELRGTDHHVIFISFNSFGDFFKSLLSSFKCQYFSHSAC